MIEGNTEFEHQLFFHTTYVNSLTSEYKHMTILFSKENDTNEWMILFLTKLFITQTSILRNSKKFNIKIDISSNYEDVSK